MRNSGCRALGGQSRTDASRNNDRDPLPHKIAGQLWKFVEPTTRKRVRKLKVLTFDKPQILETQTGRSEKVNKTVTFAGTNNPDRRHRLLCARRHRPCRCRATKKRDELAPSHWAPRERLIEV